MIESKTDTQMYMTVTDDLRKNGVIFTSLFATAEVDKAQKYSYKGPMRQNMPCLIKTA